MTAVSRCSSAAIASTLAAAASSSLSSASSSCRRSVAAARRLQALRHAGHGEGARPLQRRAVKMSVHP